MKGHMHLHIILLWWNQYIFLFLKGKFTHFQYFDMLQSLRNKNEQKKWQVKSFICSRDIDVQSYAHSAFCNENV